MTLFSGDAPDLIRLAEDEARMLGRARVEPVHLLLAFSRRGRVGELLAERGVTARAGRRRAPGPAPGVSRAGAGV